MRLGTKWLSIISQLLMRWDPLSNSRTEANQLHTQSFLSFPCRAAQNHKPKETDKFEEQEKPSPEESKE